MLRSEILGRKAVCRRVCRPGLTVECVNVGLAFIRRFVSFKTCGISWDAASACGATGDDAAAVRSLPM